MKTRAAIREALKSALSQLGVPGDGVAIVLERPRDRGHGDISCPVAMSLARSQQRNPLQIAEELAAAIEISRDVVESVDVARPGFLNFRFARPALESAVRRAKERGDGYGSSGVGGGERIQVEYVSANPTGPLVIVSARAAAVGSVVVNLLKFCGFDAEGEYYVNDHGGQVKALGASFRYRLRERFGLLDEGEEIGAYPGEYLSRIAQRVPEDRVREMLAANSFGDMERCAVNAIRGTIEDDLKAFGVEFDRFFPESDLHPEGVADALRRFERSEFAYEKDTAVYFRSTELGDDKDRVLVKSDGTPTYFLSDVAYHKTKLDRGFTRAIGLLGPDHHGHVPRMKAAMHVLGAPDDWLEIVIVGWVRLLEEGRPVSMSKRAGEFVTMRELVDDVGPDVAKYFFLMRRANSPLDFDLTLARKQSDENPVYYVQYAHARISSVVRFSKSKGLSCDPDDVDTGLLSTPEERDLMVQIMYFPLVVEGAALSREPHRLTSYAQELAATFHHFYHQCRIVTDDAGLSSARLFLAEATMGVLRNALMLLGVGAPGSM